MSKTQIVTLRVPVELKVRLEYEAKHQGVSLNNLANYFLTTQLSHEYLKKILLILNLKSEKYLMPFQGESQYQNGTLSSRPAANKSNQHGHFSAALLLC